MVLVETGPRSGSVSGAQVPRFSARSTLRTLLPVLVVVAGLMGVVRPGLATEPPVPEFTVLDGDPISAAELSRGEWALGFVILPGCPACEEVITWFGRAAQAIPQVNFLLVTLVATPKLIAFVNEHAEGIRVALDSDRSLGARLGVTRAPTVFLFMEGAQIARLGWPFTEQDLLSEVVRLAEFPDPAQLVGQAAPEFTAVDLGGSEVVLAELPRPLLLAFFNPYCPPCWTTLPTLAEISREVAVAVLALVRDAGGLAGEHRARFEGFLDGVGDRSVRVLLLEGFEVLALYQVGRIPTYILIDAQGVITWTKEGPIDEQGLRDQLQAIALERERK